MDSMRVFLTFDVEVWCDGWDHLDQHFPAAYRRYVYGATDGDGYALPMTLKILAENSLQGIFFVEPLFSARFGADKLKTIVDLIQDAGQEVQLHLHPEWCDEIEILPGVQAVPKRPHLWQFTEVDQKTLIRVGTEMMRAAGVPIMRAFRAGNFSANLDTLRALASAGYAIDSSLNATAPQSFPDGHGSLDSYSRSIWMGVQSLPISVFFDGFGRMRHAQVGACSFEELSNAVDSCARNGWGDFIILSHGFELLKPGAMERDPIVVRRFRRLCEFLRDRRDSGHLRVASMNEVEPTEKTDVTERTLPQVSKCATLRRYLEQAYRRCH